MKYLLTIVISVFLSCSSTFNGSIIPSASLSQNNFAVIRTISGESSASGWFGYVPNRAALIADAKTDMMKKNEYLLMGKARALANVTVDYQTTNIFGRVFFMVECTVTADVVEFK